MTGQTSDGRVTVKVVEVRDIEQDIQVCATFGLALVSSTDHS